MDLVNDMLSGVLIDVTDHDHIGFLVLDGSPEGLWSSPCLSSTRAHIGKVNNFTK